MTNKSEFKIIETYSGFIVKRMFNILETKWFFIWIYKIYYKREFHLIDINGNRIYYIDRLNDYLATPLSEFESFESANDFIDELIRKLNFENKEYTF